MKTKILIIEDEMLIAANISLDLSNLGYEVTGILSRAEGALIHIEQHKPDIVLLDIQLKGKMDGIELAHKIKDGAGTPIIFLTANSDENSFAKAKETKPEAFISKPFKKLDLERAIALVESRVQKMEALPVEDKSNELLEGFIFVRDHDKMVKVVLKDIQYIEAEGNYCRVHGVSKEYLVVTTLKELESKLPTHPFAKTHRSFIVNLAQIDEVRNQSLSIAGRTIPVSKTYKEELLQRLRMI